MLNFGGKSASSAIQIPFIFAVKYTWVPVAERLSTGTEGQRVVGSNPVMTSIFFFLSHVNVFEVCYWSLISMVNYYVTNVSDKPKRQYGIRTSDQPNEVEYLPCYAIELPHNSCYTNLIEYHWSYRPWRVWWKCIQSVESKQSNQLASLRIIENQSWNNNTNLVISE